MKTEMTIANMDLIIPDWPAPANVQAASTTRHGGISSKPYDSFNLALHVEDDFQCVQRNRQILAEALKLPAEPVWLNQTHSTEVACLTAEEKLPEPIMADAAYTDSDNVVCVVMTADCLPLLVCDSRGTKVAAIHAGWRGLADGIISKAIAKLRSEPSELMVWIGPAISQYYFEVGNEVKVLFESKSIANADAFDPSDRPHHWFANLAKLAKYELSSIGIEQIYGGSYCTFSAKNTSLHDLKSVDYNRFFSYRRDGVTGRMASLIWLKESN